MVEESIDIIRLGIKRRSMPDAMVSWVLSVTPSFTNKMEDIHQQIRIATVTGQMELMAHQEPIGILHYNNKLIFCIKLHNPNIFHNINPKRFSITSKIQNHSTRNIAKIQVYLRQQFIYHIQLVKPCVKINYHAK